MVAGQLDADTVGRVRSVDAFRGVVMALLLSGTYTLFREGFGIGRMAEAFHDSFIVNILRTQLSHSSWEGCTVWDLVMPAFIFLVGVAIPFSHARRVRLGGQPSDMAMHAAFRASVFALLGAVGFIIIGNLAMGRWPQHINPDFSNVLPQIGLGYMFAYLTVGKGPLIQILMATSVLAGDWLAFALYPIQSGSIYPVGLNVPPEGPGLSGFFAHWSRDANLAADFDRWFLNLLPRTDAYVANSTGMQTLNFIPTISTMVFGVLVGELLGKTISKQAKLTRMIVGSLLGIGMGFALSQTICPLVKSLWTPSWVLYSTGWVLLAFAGIYWIVEIKGRTGWTFPFVVLGTNSLLAYIIANVFDRWIIRGWEIVLGKDIFVHDLGGVLQATVAILSIWSICFVLYARGVTIRV